MCLRSLLGQSRALRLLGCGTIRNFENVWWSNFFPMFFIKINFSVFISLTLKLMPVILTRYWMSVLWNRIIYLAILALFAAICPTTISGHSSIVMLTWPMKSLMGVKSQGSKHARVYVSMCYVKLAKIYAWKKPLVFMPRGHNGI